MRRGAPAVFCWRRRGSAWAEIRTLLHCSDSYIARWTGRFAAERLAGLYSRHRGQPASKLTARLEARILEATRHAPGAGATHWSTRRLGKHLGLSHMMVARVWAKHGLKPHRLERYMASDDPDFERKAADIIGLYLKPPQHAAVFCVDEKTAIQALDRLDPVLPLSPGRAERHGFEYYRHGTLSLYAAFETRTGEVLGRTAERHTSAEFVAFLTDLVAHQPKRREIHVILDNLSAHKTKLVQAFLAEHPQRAPAFHADLLLLAQPSGALVRQDRTRRHRARHLHLRQGPRPQAHALHPPYNQAPKPVKWKYSDISRRITTTSGVTAH